MTRLNTLTDRSKYCATTKWRPV